MAQTGSSGVFKVGSLLMKGGVRVFSGSGAPTDGTSGTGAGKAGPGSLYVRTGNGTIYVNTNTQASPTWGALGTVAALASAHIFVGNGGGVATDVAVTGDVTISNTGVTAIGAGKVTNAMVVPAALDGTVAKVVADVNVIGGIPVTFRITAAALTGDIDVVMTHKIRVIDAYCINTAAGGAADTIIVKNGATAITDAMDINKADKVITRAGTIDDAAYEIAAAGTLRVSGASGATCEVVVNAIRVA
jgi:hypothetical protein